MNLLLDREAAVPLRTLLMEFPHLTYTPPTFSEVGGSLSGTRLRLSKFLESLGLWGGACCPDPAAPGLNPSRMWMWGIGLSGRPQPAHLPHPRFCGVQARFSIE